ncbi:hypothetical protein M422DRAFT_34650, partial [Sphaerobolus stellatus SS14]
MTTNASPSLAPKRYPFKPASHDVDETSPSQSSRPVTIPYLPELYQPLNQLLDSIFPHTIPSEMEAARVAGRAKAEERKKKGKNVYIPTLETTPAVNAFMSVMANVSNHTRTTNSASAFKSTKSTALDAFAGLNQNTKLEDFEILLEKSWNLSPELTLRIIWNLRSIHEGKSAREPFYRAYAWLYTRHPRTAIENLKELVGPVVKRVVKRRIPPQLARKKQKEVEVEEDMVFVTLEDAGVEVSKQEEIEEFQEVTIGLPHGYWKDLLNIVLLAARDQLTPTSDFDALHPPRLPHSTWQERHHRTRSYYYATKKHRKQFLPQGEETPAEKEARLARLEADQTIRVKASNAHNQREQHHAQYAREKKYWRLNSNIRSKLNEDKAFSALYVTVVQLFADALAKDIHLLRQIADKNVPPETKLQFAYQVSLAGKWAPTIGGAHDRATCIATPLAELLYSRSELPLPVMAFKQPLDALVAHKFRGAYNRWIVSPLRRFLQVPEVAMSTKAWDKIKYNRVPSKSMKVNKENFYNHDPDRFREYLIDVLKGKKKISGATLLPSELLQEAVRTATGLDKHHKLEIDNELTKFSAEVVQAQWQSMIDRIKEMGVLENALAICDVSSSMGTFGDFKAPIFPAIAMSLLISQVSTPPWNSCVITFSEAPEAIQLKPEWRLIDSAYHIKQQAKQGEATSYSAVFLDLILPMAAMHKLKAEDMIKRVFV